MGGLLVGCGAEPGAGLPYKMLVRAAAAAVAAAAAAATHVEAEGAKLAPVLQQRVEEADAVEDLLVRVFCGYLLHVVYCVYRNFALQCNFGPVLFESTQQSATAHIRHTITDFTRAEGGGG